MASFIDNETKKRRQEYIEECERRRKAVIDAEVSAFLESIDDICQDVEERVTNEYIEKGVPPFSVRVVCKELTANVSASKQCAEALLSALAELEESVSSVEFDVFKPTIHNQYSQSGHSYVVVNFSWE